MGHQNYTADLAVPEEFDNEGERIISGAMTYGQQGVKRKHHRPHCRVLQYAGLESFTLNSVGVEFKELAIYNSGSKAIEVFSAKGDSGSLVWHMKDGKAYTIGQLHWS